ncbi:hypothetical protein MHZ92_20790 [Sporosarcina sp. ACRSL]|uniref:hypothetical protein n=1 Tax=Sporosarcina sp. ACRSL TaxID=2918215 RepID=UPI001EF54EB8|nr:hypothetical protein [Sporosarcina sp. ACRSL]MCG7346545.1 hypothetical protein [Sporosarcina sp. ACRSL]
MKTLLSLFAKPICTIVGITILVVLTACSAEDDSNVTDIQQVQDKTESVPDVQQTQSEPVVPDNSQTTEVELPSFDDYEGYIKIISEIPSFEPYYQTAFDFEGLPDGITSVPLEEVKAMYAEMKTVFDYVLLSEYPLFHRGFYEGETSFVDGYEQYQTTLANIGFPNPINAVSRDWDGNEYLSTPLKTILLGESIFNRFDNSIETGRNLLMSDFTLASPNDPISVVLGHAYKDIYELGDIFSLELISEVMDFQVVGFYKSGVGFSKDLAALEHVNFDYNIVMPHFIPDYEPVGEAAVYQHAFHIAELTSGYISIPESVEKINDETYDQIVAVLEEMAKRYNLSGLYRIGYWPMGFVW